VNSDGGGARQVTTQTSSIGGKGGGIWSPNGKLVVFPDAPMTVLNVDSGDITSVSPGTQKGAPTWSADSSKLIYPVFNSQNGTDIYISNVDGSGTTQIPGGANWEGSLAVSPDGSKIAYISAQGDSAGLVVANMDGSGKTLVLNGATASGGGPAWSPDGQWLAVQATQGGGTGLFVVRADGSGVQELVRSEAISGLWRDGNDRLRMETYQGGM
jgi:TolB protein